MLTSGDEDDLAGQAGDICIWVKGVGSHCFGLVVLQGMGMCVMLLGCGGTELPY
jgi:hypothetical protein